MNNSIEPSTGPPYREIRAHYDDHFITVYQAYKSSIAEAAVATQKLNAAPDFRPGRMTWTKPSWSWMMYRAGYGFKDPGQAHILAIKMRHEHFLGLLERGVPSTEAQGLRESSDARHDKKHAPKPKTKDVRIQWDPERTPQLHQLPYRSIQIGIPADISDVWTREWIAEIIDVTETAKALKTVLDKEPELTIPELVDMGLVPSERPYHVPEDIRRRLQMTEVSSTAVEGDVTLKSEPSAQ
jgi:hypothetical protein